MSYNESLDPNSNYPQMSQHQWDNAPFNEPFNEERTFEVTCTVTLEKAVQVTTRNYQEYVDDENGHLYCDVSETDWKAEYQSGHYSLENLLEILEDYLMEDLKRRKGNAEVERRLNKILFDCQQWNCIEENYEY